MRIQITTTTPRFISLKSFHFIKYHKKEKEPRFLAVSDNNYNNLDIQILNNELNLD